MSVQNFNDLNSHWGHDVEVSRYVDDNGEIVNVSIECTQCYEVLLDYDREGANE